TTDKTLEIGGMKYAFNNEKTQLQVTDEEGVLSEYKDPKLIRDIIDGVSAQKNKTNGVVKIDNDSTYSVDAEGNVFYLSGGKKTPSNKSGLPETMAVDIKNRIKALETGGSLYNIDKNGNVYEIKE